MLQTDILDEPVSIELDEILKSAGATNPYARLLIISFDSVELPNSILGECVLYVIPPGLMQEGADRDKSISALDSLPFTSGSFDIVVGIG